jgi:hypothetical protein
MYEGWAHTDTILEGPLTGDNSLCEDIIAQIRRTFPITPVSTTSSSSRASFDASGNILSSTSTTNSQSHSQPTRARSRTNSIPQSLVNLTPSASREDLLSSDFIDTMSGRIPENENESGSGSVVRGLVRENGIALVDSRSEVWARAVCSRCSLRYSVSHSENPQNAQNGHSGCHDVISDLLERNGRFDGGCDKDQSSILDDSEKNNHSLFIAKCESHVSHAVAVSVAVPAPALPTNGNGRNVLAGTDHRCYGTVLLPTQGEERHCSCHGAHTNTHTHTHPDEEVLANALNFNNNKRKKGDVGMQSSDNFADCRVPFLLVGVARWVNPF